MASPQFNLRLRDTLDDQVRALALQHRVNPRDVIEDALIGHYGFRRRGPGVDPAQLAIPVPAAAAATLAEPETAASGGPPAVSGRGCPDCGGELRLLITGAGVPARLACVDCGHRPEPADD